MDKLPRKFKDRIFAAKELKAVGANSYDLQKLVANGTIEQVARGIYRATALDLNEEDRLRIATLRVGKPSAICLVSALSFHGLTDSRNSVIQIMVPTTKTSEHKDIKTFRVNRPKWNIGIEKHDGYSVTTVERTIIDCLTYRAWIGSSHGLNALREAIEKKKTKPSQLMDMAVALGVQHRVLPYLEAYA